MQHTGVDARFLHIFWSRDNAVVGTESNDVVSTAHFSVEMLKQLVQILVEPDENVLYFPAARTERVADIVDRRVADAQKVRSAAFTQTQLIDCVLRHLSQVGIGVGARRPLQIER